jgi:hypothetical protein
MEIRIETSVYNGDAPRVQIAEHVTARKVPTKHETLYPNGLYEVRWNGEVIGTVHKRRRNRYQKSGRLISRTTSAGKWFWNGGSLERDTLKQAAEECLIDYFREIGKL